MIERTRNAVAAVENAREVVNAALGGCPVLEETAVLLRALLAASNALRAAAFAVCEAHWHAKGLSARHVIRNDTKAPGIEL